MSKSDSYHYSHEWVQQHGYLAIEDSRDGARFKDVGSNARVSVHDAQLMRYFVHNAQH